MVCVAFNGHPANTNFSFVTKYIQNTSQIHPKYIPNTPHSGSFFPLNLGVKCCVLSTVLPALLQ